MWPVPHILPDYRCEVYAFGRTYGGDEANTPKIVTPLSNRVYCTHIAFNIDPCNDASPLSKGHCRYQMWTLSWHRLDQGINYNTITESENSYYLSQTGSIVTFSTVFKLSNNSFSTTGVEQITLPKVIFTSIAAGKNHFVALTLGMCLPLSSSSMPLIHICDVMKTEEFILGDRQLSGNWDTVTLVLSQAHSL